MKKYIVKHIKDHIESLRASMAQNYVSVRYHSEPERASLPSSKKEVDAGTENNKRIAQRVEWLKKLLKEEEAK